MNFLEEKIGASRLRKALNEIIFQYYVDKYCKV